MYNSLLYPPLHYCWGGCYPFFFYGWRRDPLLCYPPYTTVGADAARFSYGWLRDPLLCAPPTRRVEQPFTVLPPYTTPRLNAACFGAMSVGVLDASSLSYPPRLHLG